MIYNIKWIKTIKTMEKSLNELLGDIQSNYEQFIDLSEHFIDKQKQQTLKND